MIAEVFLCAALAPAPMAMANGYTHGPITAERAVITSADFVTRGKKTEDLKFLFVGNDPAFVRVFRDHGLKAFGALTDDWPGITAWHAVTNTDYISFQSRIFYMVYVLQNNPLNDTCFDLLKEAVRLTAPEGLVVFNETAYEDWPAMLRHWNWERLPFLWGDFAMWKRPVNGNGLSFAYKKSMQVMGKNVVPFKQLHVFMEGVHHVTERILSLRRDEPKRIDRALPGVFGTAA